MSVSATGKTAVQSAKSVTPTLSDTHHNTTTRSQRAALHALLMRLHFYIGLFVGPFIFVAALTGTVYVLTPQIESMYYSTFLFTGNTGEAHPLSQQINAATQALSRQQPAAKLTAVRPSPSAGQTTRVMFSLPSLGPSESYAVFVDPVSLEVRGSATVYGTSGILPFRTMLDYLHRQLLLGEVGRNYSELAASWLWLAALGGVYLWISTRKVAPKLRQLTQSASRKFSPVRQHQHLRHRHSMMGLCLIIGLVFFSATGLTWSRWAGDNVAALRAAMGWLTPSVNTQLKTPSLHDMSVHAEHQLLTIPAASPPLRTTFDKILAVAREAGIDAGKIEIRPATKPQRAWTVSEIDRSWPTQVDAIAIDPITLTVIDKVRFADYPLAAKLTRWGIDAHMGILFGLPNQLLLAAFGLSLCTLIIWGYKMWWIRRPRHRAVPHPIQTLTTAFLALRTTAKALVLLITTLLAITLPVMGISLVLFLLVDIWRWTRARRYAIA
ncbi:PepSY-associated TM helix domain-containing protein [Dickeya aquatica]|uniref:PepSY-associated TM helix domain-containing protein n=1 Tax=Dickeya aquatica TaxID=1401087 RepID=UPI0015DAF5D8|nr:PepSY-associated TM helix domain-containing protein [Dickeya aquatica]